MQWTGNLSYKDLIKKIVYKPESNKCIIHWVESCPGIATVIELRDQELNEHYDDEKYNYYQWDTMDRTILATLTATYEEYKETR